MARVPIIRVGNVLIATVQEDLRDSEALELQEGLSTALEQTNARGVLLDISVVETVDSFLGRLMADIASTMLLFGAPTVVVGMQPAVAITLTELGLELKSVWTALNPDKGLALIQRVIAEEERKATRRNG